MAKFNEGSHSLTYNTILHPFNGPFPGQPVYASIRKETIRDFSEARDDGMTVASAGPHANHLNLAPDHASTSTLSFYMSDSLPAAKTTAPKQ